MASNAGFRTFAAGAVLTATQINDYLMTQTVMTFATAAARASAIVAPVEGMWTYTADTDTLWYYNGSSWFPKGPLYVRKTADQSVISSTVLVNDSDLTFAIAANEVWVFDAFLHASIIPAADLKLTFTGPTGSTVVWGVVGAGAADASATITDIAAVNMSAGLAKDGTVVIGGEGGGQGQVVIAKGIITNGSTAGNLTFQWAQNAASGTNTVKAGSFMSYQRLA